MIVFLDGPSDLGFPSRRSSASPPGETNAKALFAALCPPLKAVSETFQFAPADDRVQILISASWDRTPRDCFLQLSQSSGESFANARSHSHEGGATLDNGGEKGPLTSYSLGDIATVALSRGRQAICSRPPIPAWTGVRVTDLGGAGGAPRSISRAVARDYVRGPHQLFSHRRLRRTHGARKFLAILSEACGARTLTRLH